VKSLQWKSSLDNDPNESWLNIKGNILKLRDKYVGLKKKSKNKNKWVTKKVRKCRQIKKKAWINYVNSNRDDRLYQIYKTKLNISVMENRKAKRIFEEKLANNIKNDAKSFFAYANSKKRSNNKVGPLRNSQGEVLENSKQTADLLNDYFASVFTVEDSSSLPEAVKFFRGPQSECLSMLEINENMVLEK
jgi:hypothetical protein